MPYEKFGVMQGNPEETLKQWSRKLEYLFNKNLNVDNVVSTGLIVPASLVTVDDTGGYFASSNTDVEDVLQQIGSTFLNIPAGNVKINDTGLYYTSTSVEGALQELASTIQNLPSSYLNVSFLTPLESTTTNIKLNYSARNFTINASSELDTIQNIASSDNPTFKGITFSTGVDTASTVQGTVYWDNQDETLSVVMAGGNVKQQIGQEIYIKAVNKTGVQINNGSLVYINGAQGNRPIIELANANNYSNSQKVIGMATENIGIDAYGYVTTFGLVRDLNTNSYADGDSLYLSTNSGGYSTAPPTEGLAKIKIGIVLKSHVTDGWILVNINEDKYMFGDVDSGNYSLFESDGTLKFNGNATVFDDVNGSVLRVQVVGVGLSVNNLENTLDYSTAADLSDYSYDNYQFSHKRKLGTYVYPHTHWVQKENNTPNFLVRYRWQINGQPHSTTWNNYILNSNAFTYTAGSLNQITGGTGISAPSTDGISGVLQLRFFRDNTNASALFPTTNLYSTTANIMFLDIHNEIDTLGSRQEYIK